ncbi:MAG: hypothetical protein V8Q36_00585 [Anaerotignum sp.]
MEDVLQGLNAAQYEAGLPLRREWCVSLPGEGVLGKPVLCRGVLPILVNEIGILPGNILCVTFTNKISQ